MPLKSAASLAEEYRSGASDPKTVAQSMLEKIDSLNPELDCFITVLRDSALKSAAESAARFASGSPLGPLDGVPVAVKDLFYIKGVRCTAGSRILSENVAEYDAPAIRRLKSAGAVLVGTTNLHEFAAGVTSVNPHFGAVRNPWDQTKVAGGSSGGSAAAVAAGMASCALGTDTAGSVRIPAALCGVLGMKPTYGLLSRLGVVPLAPSLDTVGTLTLSARDAASMLDVLAGHDPEDLTTVSSPPDSHLSSMGRPTKGIRVGVPRGFFHEFVTPKVEAEFDRFLEKLKEIGCLVEEVKLEFLAGIYEKWLPIRRAEATAFHMKWLQSSPGLYGDDVRKLLELGRDVLAVDYVSALNARPALMEKAALSMAELDVVALPATCVPAPSLHEKTLEVRGAPTEVYQALNRLTLPFNYLGLPALSVPSGSVDGLPVGAQLVSEVFQEGTCLSVADGLESHFGPWPEAPSGQS